MIISRLVLGNWRNFRSADVRLGERTFLVGANGVGKSNLMDSLLFLHDVAQPGGGLQTAVARRGGFSQLRSLSAGRENDIEISVEVSGTPPWRYSIGIARRPGGQHAPVLRYERVWLDTRLALDRPDAEDRRDPSRLTQTRLEAGAEFQDLSRFLASIRSALFGPALLEAIASTVEKTRRARLGRVEAALRAAVPQLKRLASVRDETGAPHLEAEFEHWRAGAGGQREDQLSEGTLRLAGLWWALLDGEGPLLLDKPERSLPAPLVRDLPALLRRGPQRQVLVSTHSGDLLADKEIKGDEALLLTPGPDGTRVEAASELMDVRAMLESGASVAEAVLPRCGPGGGEKWPEALS